MSRNLRSKKPMIPITKVIPPLSQTPIKENSSHLKLLLPWLKVTLQLMTNRSNNKFYKDSFKLQAPPSQNLLRQPIPNRVIFLETVAISV
jgi:hypothetical protein